MENDDMVELDKVVDDFEIPATGDKSISLRELQGKNVVLYFYPRDSTPGCTTEGRDFGAKHDEFTQLDTVILGVSRDTLASHERFKEKQAFPFDLLSDKEEVLCQLFDVIKEKNMYGKKVMGIERSTFIIDKAGILKKEYRKIKVAGHVDEILAAVQAL